MNTDDVIPARQLIGRLIRKERERQGLTRYALEQLCETSRTQIRSIEEGSSAYTLDAFLRVWGALDCSIVLLNAEWEPSEVIRMVQDTSP
jgi:transcriptional regulator with XRE-family HTH domain